MCRLIRVPAALDNFVHPLAPRVHWNHFIYFRWLVVPMALMWGRRHVANRSRDLAAPSHRTRVHHVFFVEP
jgi:hypothetical protein